MDDERSDPLLLPASPSRRAQLVREIGYASLEVERAMLRANSKQYMELKLLKSAVDAAHQVLVPSRR